MLHTTPKHNYTGVGFAGVYTQEPLNAVSGSGPLDLWSVRHWRTTLSSTSRTVTGKLVLLFSNARWTTDVVGASGLTLRYRTLSVLVYI